MKQIVPIVLAVLMLSSVFAGIDMDELNETKITDTGGRDAYELTLHDVLEPRATNVETGRNTIDIGDVVKFRPVIINDGDSAQTEFNIHLTVAPAAAPSNYIIDVSDDAVCPGNVTVTLCSFNTLASGDFLGGGNYHVKNLDNSDVTWAPTSPGNYEITITVEPVMEEHDSDLTNNEMSYFVSVQHFQDIQVDLCWTDSNGDCMESSNEQGLDSKNFALVVNSSGSQQWDAREVTLSVTFGGAWDQSLSSFDADGDGIMTGVPNSGAVTVVHGSDQTVDIWHNLSNAEQTDPGSPCVTNDNPCQDTRKVAPYGVVTKYVGTISGDTGGSGVEAMTVSASLVDYTGYEQTDIDDGQGENSTTSSILEEVTVDFDDRTGNNDDEITAYFSVFHDVAITSLTGGDNDAAEGVLNVGSIPLTATVVGAGSDMINNAYDWRVLFSVKEQGGDGTELLMPGQDESNSCATEEEDTYEHKLLGNNPPAAPEGIACVMVDLPEGKIYTVMATVELVDQSLTDGDSANDCGTGSNDACQADMNGGNNVRGTYFEIINVAPTVYATIDAITRDGEVVDAPIIVGDAVTLSARGSDVETDDLALRYSWERVTADGMVFPIDCQEGPDSGQCTEVTDMTWVGERAVTVTVSDFHGATATDILTPKVWNHYMKDVADPAVSYSLVYEALVEYNLSITNGESVTGATLGSNAGSYDSVMAINLASATSSDLPLFSPASVGAESLVVTYSAGDANTDYDLWFQFPGQPEWTAMGTTVTAGANGGVTLTLERNSVDLPNIEAGTYAIFETSSAGDAPPATGITNLLPALQPNGRVSFTWDLSEPTMANANTDSVHVYVCATSGCDATAGDHYGPFNVATTESWTLADGQDGTTYTVVVRVENGNTDSVSGATLFGTPVGSSTVTADGSVSPSPAITDLATSAKDLDEAVDGDDALGFTWSATGTTDVAQWKICWAAFQFATSDWNGLENCETTEDSAMSLDISEQALCGGPCSSTLYFGVAGVDAVGNVDTAEAALAKNLGDGLDAPDTIFTPADDTESEESDAPQKAMYAIIALVVLAVIGGAFILTRGGGGEGEDKEWDY